MLRDTSQLLQVMADQQQLGNVNNQLVAQGQSFPEVTLKDGSRVQTGTVAALLNNIKRFNAGVKEAEQDIRVAVPTVAQVGLFDLFPPEEWKSVSNPGRSLVGKLGSDHLKQSSSS